MKIELFNNKFIRNQIQNLGEESYDEIQKLVSKISSQRGVHLLPPRNFGSNFTPLKYTKAKTVLEAEEYATKTLGIKDYLIPDLELANQVNLSLTHAYNQTRGKIKAPDIIEYTKNFGIKSGQLHTDVPMQTLVNKVNGITKLEINENYFDNLDTKIAGLLTELEENNQLVKNYKGQDCIQLVSGYKYEYTLNRYYRLYKEGKLTKKAKADFVNLLITGLEAEQYLLVKKDSLVKTIKKCLGIDLSDISHSRQSENFNKQAKKYLIEIQNVHKRKFSSDYKQTKNAIGVDGEVLHEAGHVWHAKTSLDAFSRSLDKYPNLEEQYTMGSVSKYATTLPAEGVAEVIKGLLSGDKYDDEIIQLANQYTKGKLSFLV